MSQVVELLPGWTASPVVDDADTVVGYIETHPHRTTSEPCRGFLPIRPMRDRPLWTVVSTSPLELAPSIRCRACGRHYFIAGGSIVLAPEP